MKSSAFAAAVILAALGASAAEHSGATGGLTVAEALTVNAVLRVGAPRLEKPVTAVGADAYDLSGPKIRLDADGGLDLRRSGLLGNVRFAGERGKDEMSSDTCGRIMGTGLMSQKVPGLSFIARRGVFR